MSVSPAGWAIRLFEPGNYNKGYDIISNFKGFKERTLDSIIVFNGIYGLDSYILWYIHPDLKSYDLNTVNLDLKLFTGMNKNRPFWENVYRVVEIRFDISTKKYVLLGLSEDSIILNTKLSDWNLKSLSYSKKRTGYQALKEILEDNNIFAVMHFESSNKDLIDFLYPQLTFNPEWRVRDLINYVCDNNGYEWYVCNKVLYIGKELWARKKMIIQGYYDETRDRVAESSFFKKVIGNIKPADVLGHLNKEWRCIWAKHIVGGKSGGMTKCCFSKIGAGRVDKLLYLHTLEGDREKANATYIFSHNQFNSYSIGIGNIIKDEGNQLFVDQISVQKDSDTYKLTNPSEMIFDRGTENEESRLVEVKEQIPRTTPYLDDKAGLLFPSPKLDNTPPNSIIFNVNDREESSVVGPYIVGNGGDLVIPVKEKGDLRLQLPNGWCLYVKEDGTTYLKVKKVDSQTKASGILKDDSVWIKLGASPADEDIEMNSPEVIRLMAVNDIALESEQTITIDADTIVYVGPSANAVLLAGGGHKISHADHTHPLTSGVDGLFNMPLKGVALVHDPADGSVISEVD